MPSVSFVTGSELTRKLVTLYASVPATHTPDEDGDPDGTEVVLGTTSNRVDRCMPAFLPKVEAGGQHIVIAPAALVAPDDRGDFPNAREFVKDEPEGQRLEQFLAAGAKDKPHFVAVVPAVHANKGGTNDVLPGKIDDGKVQAFGDAHGSRGATWLLLTSRFDPAAHDYILANKAALKGILPTITVARMVNRRPVLTAVTTENESELADGLEALDARLDEAAAAGGDATAAVPSEIGGGDTLSLADGGGGATVATGTSPAGDAKTAEARRKADVNAGHRLMYGSVGKDGIFRPAEFNERGETVHDAATRQDTFRAYQSASLKNAEELAQPENTHYLGRLATTPRDGITDYVAACRAQGIYRPTPLESLETAKRVKNGATVAHLIPEWLAESAGTGEEQGENNERLIQGLLGEAPTNLTNYVAKSNVNIYYRSYDDMMGTLGNTYAEQGVMCKMEPLSALSEMAVIIGDALSIPRVKTYWQRKVPTDARMSFSILNTIEQAYLKATAQYSRREELPRVTAGRYEDVDTRPYTDIIELARATAVRVKSVALGGDRYVECALYETSECAKELKRKEDEKRAKEMITIRDSLERRNESNNRDRGRERDRDGRGGDGEREAKKAKREKERADRQAQARLKSTEEDKAGDIFSSGFLKLPKLTGGKRMCGAYYRDGVACSSMLLSGKCNNCHTAVMQMSKDDQQIVLDYVNGTDGLSFNPKTVTCFTKVNGKYVRPM